MTLHADRMQRIMVDVSLGIAIEESRGYPFTEEELAFRVKMEDEIPAAHARGEVIDFTPELP